MSKVFYDHLIELESLEKVLKKHIHSQEEREEVYHLIDEIVHHRVTGCLLDRLPKEHHKEFLEKFADKPHDLGLLEYLKERIGSDVESFVREEVYLLGNELLELIKPTKN